MSTSDEDLINELIKNSVALEKASIELIKSVKSLDERIGKLLTLFEDAAKNISKAELSEPLSQQLQSLLEQNKTLARGLVMLEKYVREKQPESQFTPSSLNQQKFKKLI